MKIDISTQGTFSLLSAVAVYKMLESFANNNLKIYIRRDSVPEKKKCMAEVVRQEKIADGIYSMWLGFSKDYNIAAQSVPGQFLSLYSRDGSRLLPRPISICETDADNAVIRIVYRVVGKGTEEFSKLCEGDKVPVVGPLGNGFNIEAGSAILIGGGIGIPPMLSLAKKLHNEGSQNIKVVLGYRDNNLFLKNEFEPFGEVFVSTEDGSAGIKGNVIDAIGKNDLSADTIYACGPIPMLRGVKGFASERGILAQISLEEKMACGIGACLACVCETKEKDSHSHVCNRRVCKDGPVFDARDIEI